MEKNKSTLLIILLALFAVLVAIPLELQVLKIFIALEVALCISILFYAFTKQVKSFPLLLIAFTIISLFVNIGLTRLFLISVRENQNPPVNCLSGMVIHPNIILNILIILVFSLFVYLLSMPSSKKMASDCKFQIDVASKFLMGNSKAIILITLLNIVAGVIINYRKNNVLSYIAGVKNIIPFTTVNIIIFSVPQIIVLIAFLIKCRRIS